MKAFLLLALMISFKVNAHPVSYGGALSLMSMNNQKMRSNTIHYTINRWSSLGVTSLTKEEGHFYFPRVGLLLHRWNGDDYQANVYLKGGYGEMNWKDSTRKNSGMYNGLFQVDWETRKYFVEAKYNRNESSGYIDDSYTFRVGYAPYVAKYDELNIWFMLKQMQHPRDEDENMTTPMLRMFYKNVLWEVGASTDGSWMINFAIREFL